MQTNLTLEIMSYIAQQGATDMQTESIQNISHFIWDFDGTLFDTYPVIIEDIRQALQSFGFDAEPKELMDKLLETVDYALEFYAEQYHIDNHALFDAYRQQQKNSNAKLLALPMDQAENVLKAIQAKDCANYIFTHRPFASTMAFLDKYDLSKYFTDFVAPTTPGFARKPAPDAIEYLIDKYGIPKEKAVMIGDRELDLASGKNAGIRTVHYICKTIPQTLSCDWRYENFADFAKALTNPQAFQKTDETP